MAKNAANNCVSGSNNNKGAKYSNIKTEYVKVLLTMGKEKYFKYSCLPQSFDAVAFFIIIPSIQNWSFSLYKEDQK